MKTRKIIKGLRPMSAIVMGCDHMGEAISINQALSELELYASCGGNVLDTARSYALIDGVSISEKTVGEFLRSSGCRHEMIVMTKGGRDIEPFSDYLKKAREDYLSSCDQLGTVPDVWFLHRDCPSLPVAEIIQYCTSFLQGSLLGLSNWSPSRFTEAMAQGSPAISEIQFSLAPSTPQLHGDSTLVCMDQENRRFYKASQIPVLAYSSQAKGYFSKLIAGTDLSAKAKQRFDNPISQERVFRVQFLGRQLDVPPAAIVTSYIASQKDFPAFPIVAGSSLAQLEESLQGGDVELSSSQIAYLESSASNLGD
jgi:aryl-alcohol dehydrogenase-like predicted oxidoreductase